MPSIDRRIGIIGATAAFVAAGCGAPKPPDTTFSPAPTPEHTMVYGPALPESTQLTHEQIIKNDINKRGILDQNEINNWISGPQAGFTFPPEANDPKSQDDLNTRGRLEEPRVEAEFAVMKNSGVSLISRYGQLLDKSVPYSFNMDIDLFNDSVDPMNLLFVPDLDPQFGTSLSAGFLNNQDSRQLGISFVRLGTGFEFANRLEDPGNLTNQQVLEFASISYGNEVEAYLQLAAKTGYFTIDYDPYFEEVVSTYIQHGINSEEYRNLMEQIVGLPGAVDDSANS